MAKKTETANKEELKPSAQKGKIKRILLPALLILILIAGGIGIYTYNQNINYFITDNAKVTAKMYPVLPIKSGELLEWNVSLGAAVKKGEVLGRQDVSPYITSPIDGIVVKDDAVLGQLVSPSMTLAVIADSNDMYIGVNIEETHISRIRVGQIVDVTIDAYKGAKFSGMITEIDPTTQTYFSNSMGLSTSGTYTKVVQLIPVKVKIENPSNLVMTYGMNASVKIHTKDPIVHPDSEITGSASDNRTDDSTSQVNVSANISGKVNTVAVSAGQSVEQGELLFTLDSTDIELQEKQALANYNIAATAYANSNATLNDQASSAPERIAYNEAVDNYSRIKQLYSEGAVSQIELDTAKDKMDTAAAKLKTTTTAAKNAVTTAKAQLDSASAALDIAKKKLEDCQITAPISGQIITCNVSVGDIVSPGTTSITIMDSNK